MKKEKTKKDPSDTVKTSTLTITATGNNEPLGLFKAQLFMIEAGGGMSAVSDMIYAEHGQPPAVRIWPVTKLPKKMKFLLRVWVYQIPWGVYREFKFDKLTKDESVHLELVHGLQ